MKTFFFVISQPLVLMVIHFANVGFMADKEWLFRAGAFIGTSIALAVVTAILAEDDGISEALRKDTPAAVFIGTMTLTPLSSANPYVTLLIPAAAYYSFIASNIFFYELSE